MKKESASNLEIQERLFSAEREGIITSKERGFFVSELNKGMRSQVDVVGELTEAENKHTEALKAQREERGEIAPIGEGVSETAQASIDAFLAGRAIPVEIVPFFKDLDLDIGSQIQTAMAQIDFEEAGGRELVADFQETLEGLNVGEISQTLADQLFAEMFVQAEQIKVAMGEITADEAARNIAKTLGVAFQDALNLVLNIEQTLLNIDGLKVRAQILIKIKQTGGETIPGVNLAQILGGQADKKARAHGGFHTAGRPNVVGERGPEVFNPGVSGTITPNNRIGGDMSVLEGKFDKLSSDITNALLDVGQKIAERG